ncbi:MAG: sarcosine oxidase subunit gamma [Proteobacteria bacterium]|nr:sarcosine oxidase subunit gamma [Pseudomonadota bacterium]
MQKEHGYVSESAQSLTAKNRPVISELTDVSVTHLAARREMRTSLDDVARSTFGVALPATPRVVEAPGVMIVWAGPDQWLVMQQRGDKADIFAELAKTFNGLASVVDVSDSRAIFRVAASRPSDALVRSMGIDLDDSVFRPGDVAITHVSHLGVMVWRLPDATGYDFACPRTYSRDFLDWLGKI